MPSLPIHGQDPWDADLVAWLLTSRNADGTLKLASLLAALGIYLPAFLLWSDTASDYLPVDQKASSSPKVFLGPTDPLTVAGVVMNVYDLWISATA